MTPKQAYERRRAEREAQRAASDERYGRRPPIRDDIDADEIIDRIATSLERIADALESQPR